MRRKGRKEGKKIPEPKPQAFAGIAGGMGKAYGALAGAYSKAPQLPLLDKGTSALLLLCLAAYAAFVAFVLMTTPATEITTEISETPLVDNERLTLQPGERYTYEANFAGSKAAISYRVFLDAACPGLKVVENAGEEENTLCIHEETAEAASHLSFGNQSVLLTAPWMLALTENFSWSLKSTSKAGGLAIETPMRFDSEGLVMAGGREAFLVGFESGMGGAAPVRYYIDKEKRVLLRLESGNLSVRLVSAPFALDWN